MNEEDPTEVDPRDSRVSDEDRWRLLRGPSPDTERAAMFDLSNRLRVVEETIARFEKIAGKTPPPRSVMGVDDRMASPELFSTVAGYTLSVAVDNMKALIALLDRGDDAVTLYQVAQYPLIRSAIEAGAVATWLLGPEDRRTRMLHLLQVATDELTYDSRLIKRVSLIQSGDSAEERSKRNKMQRSARDSRQRTEIRLAAIAQRNGIAFEEYEKGLPGWMELIGAATQWAYVDRADMGPTTWFALSGLTHPSTTRALMFSVLEEDSPAVDGVHTARLSASVQSVSMGVACALQFMFRAEDLNRRRRLHIDGSPDQVPKS